MNQPYFVSGHLSVTPLWQWILQIEYIECQTITPSFALCPHIHYIQLPHCCFYYFQRLIFFGTLGWVLFEPCDLLCLNYRTYSTVFTVVTVPSFLFSYLLSKAIAPLKYQNPSFVSLTLFAVCPADSGSFQHATVTTGFFIITSLCCPPVYPHLLG